MHDNEAFLPQHCALWTCSPEQTRLPRYYHLARVSIGQPATLSYFILINNIAAWWMRNSTRYERRQKINVNYQWTKKRAKRNKKILSKLSGQPTPIQVGKAASPIQNGRSRRIFLIFLENVSSLPHPYSIPSALSLNNHFPFFMPASTWSPPLCWSGRTYFFLIYNDNCQSNYPSGWALKIFLLFFHSCQKPKHCMILFH